MGSALCKPNNKVSPEALDEVEAKSLPLRPGSPVNGAGFEGRTRTLVFVYISFLLVYYILYLPPSSYDAWIRDKNLQFGLFEVGFVSFIGQIIGALFVPFWVSFQSK